MSWQPFSFHFKQIYEGGYRYLDRCGELMVHLCQKFDFVPSDPKVTGAAFQSPEKGLVGNVDTQALSISGELTRVDDFISACKGVSELVVTEFKPTSVLSNTFAVKAAWAFASSEEALKASLKIYDDKHQSDLAKLVGMASYYKNIDYNFLSGSSDLSVKVRPVALEKVAINKYSATLKASAAEKRKVERLNAGTKRLAQIFPYAVFLEIDLVETNPPADSLELHFQRMMGHYKKVAEQIKL